MNMILDHPIIIMAIAFWVILLFSMSRDRSRYRNCYFLLAASLCSVPALCALAGADTMQTLIFCLLFTMILALVVTIFLIVNGIIMIRKEGHSFGNLLSLLLGIVIIIGEIATFFAVFSPWTEQEIHSRIVLLMTVISLSVIYICLNFAAFVLYTLLLQIIPRKSNFDYVIIHGAGLLGGNRVSRLLAERIDKAIEVYRKDPTPTVLIPSGGKGKDETISEAEAMRQYLLSRGIPDSDILLEDHSTSTYENLQYSRKVIRENGGRQYTALVTSNYHVYRALRYCRKIGLKCTGIGSHVALYYWPSAVIREFVAIHREKKHAFWFIVGWLIFLLPVAFAMI